MSKLTDTQLFILSAASQRDSRLVLPVPKTLKGGAKQKSIDSLLAKGLIEEHEANRLTGDPVWRNSSEGRALTLLLTDAGVAALAGHPSPKEGNVEKKGRKLAKAVKTPPTPRVAATKPVRTRGTVPRVREGTKQARLIEMLKRPQGTTIAELAEALGWQAHTVRGALAGALKKKLGLAVTSETDHERGRIYRIG